MARTYKKDFMRIMFCSYKINQMEVAVQRRMVSSEKSSFTLIKVIKSFSHQMFHLSH